MAMFGSGFKYATQDDLAQAPVMASPDQLSQAVAPLEVGKKVGLFGGEWDNRRKALLLAGIADAIDPLTMNPTGGGLSTSIRKQFDDEAAEKARTDAFAGAYDPQTGRIDLKKVIASYTQSGAKVPDAIWAAASKPEAVESVEGPDGIYERASDGTWTRKAKFDPKPDPYESLRADLLKAQIERTGNQADYYGVKTRQPYAPKGPPRLRSTGSSATSSPAAAVYDPSTVKWN